MVTLQIFCIVVLTAMGAIVAMTAKAVTKLPAELRPPVDESLKPRFRSLPRAADYAWLSVRECQIFIGSDWRRAEDKGFVSPAETRTAESACTDELVAANRSLAV